MQKAAAGAREAYSADRAILLELNRNYVRSALESDVRWYSENLSEDFYITRPTGPCWTATRSCSASLIPIPARKQRLWT
jgi:hypothetical protein